MDGGVDRLRKHQDWSGKYCPHDILDRYGWDNFKNQVQTYLTALG
jgi:N-acetylmuramoyl-L-alanine amidase